VDQYYNLIKYIHVLAAIVWVGGAFTLQVLAIRASRSDDPADLPRIGAWAEYIGTRLFIPASLILFVAGLIMVVNRWAFSDLWVSISMLLWILSALTGALYLGPRTKKVGELFAAEGPTSVGARAGMQRLFLVSRLELISFAIIVFLMVVKPA
jgi:uncharacterized membrane protein